MTRYILPAILLIASIGSFFLVTNPMYASLRTLKTQSQAYSDALTNSKKLQSVRDQLNARYSGFDPASLERLNKLLPDNPDNIKMIIEIENIATPYGMILKNVKFDAPKKKTAESGFVTGTTDDLATASKDYGIFNLEFSTTGTYNNFQNFLKDLEKSLRIIDISSIAFTSVDSATANGVSDVYKYDFKIKTYWLKN